MVSTTIKICNKVMRLVQFNAENGRVSPIILRSIVVREAGGDPRTITKYIGKNGSGFLFSLGYLRFETQNSYRILRSSIGDEKPSIKKKNDSDIEKYGD